MSSNFLDVACAAQRFLLDVLPLSDQASPRVVNEFCDALHQYRVGRAATEGVIVGVVRKLEVAVGVSDQMVLAQYFALEPSTPDQCARLKICVDRLIRSHSMAHPAVGAALRMIDEFHADYRFRLEVLAKRLRMSPSYLSHLISVHTGVRFRGHLRTVRMRAAATRFAEGSATIQEVAASVGYGHLADFDHHFKAHFGVTPSTYRAQLSMSGASPVPATQPTKTGRPQSRSAVSFRTDGVKLRRLGSFEKAHVLVVEDDRSTGHAFGRILAGAGYEVAVAADTSVGQRLFQQHSPHVTIAGSAATPARILSFVRRVRECCNNRQSLALVTADAALTEDEEKELTNLRVPIALKPLLPGEIVGLVGQLVASAY